MRKVISNKIKYLCFISGIIQWNHIFNNSRYIISTSLIFPSMLLVILCRQFVVVSVKYTLVFHLDWPLSFLNFWIRRNLCLTFSTTPYAPRPRTHWSSKSSASISKASPFIRIEVLESKFRGMVGIVSVLLERNMKKLWNIPSQY